MLGINRSIKNKTWTALSGCLCLGLFYAWRTSPFERVILPEDGCTYVLLAKSILQGKGLLSLWVDGTPPHAKAPFGFPLFLAPFIAWHGIDTGILTYAVTGLTTTAFAATFLFFRRISNGVLALFLVILTAMNASVYVYGRSILSEIPYLFWSLFSLWAFEKYKGIRITLACSTGLALALLAAFFTRTAGIFLMLAVGSAIFIEREKFDSFIAVLKRHWILFVALPLPAGWWFMRQVNMTAQTHVSYLKDFIGGNYNEPFALTGFILRIVKGAYALVFYAIPKVLTNMAVPSRSYGMGFLALITLSGLAWCLVHKKRAVDIYMALYLGFACCWPWMQVSGVRYMAPVVPFLIYYFYIGVFEGKVFVILNRTLPMIRPIILGAAILCYGIHSPLLRISKNAVTLPDQMPATYAWINLNTSANSVFVSWTPISLYLYAGRHSADFASSTFNAHEFEQLLLSGKVDYIFSDMSMEQSTRILAPVYVRNYHYFHLVYAQGRHKIYRVKETMRLRKS